MKWNDYFGYETGDESVCVTMEGSERSYELLGRYGEGQKLYDMEKQVDGSTCIVFSSQTSQTHPLRVKLPTLDATKQHLLALDSHWYYLSFSFTSIQEIQEISHFTSTIV